MLGRKTISLLLVIISIISSCTNQKKNQNDDRNVIVTTSSGLILRQQPTVASKRFFTLIKNTNVEVLEKGKSDSINGINDFWYKIKLGDYEGWVFGKYISNTIPTEFYTAYKYITYHNGSAVIYINLFNNKQFDLYFESLELDNGNYTVMSGTWTQDNDFIIISFNKNQPLCKPCYFDALFIDPNGKAYDEDIIMVDKNNYKFKKDNIGVVIYGISCMKN